MIDPILAKLFTSHTFSSVLDLGAGEGQQALFAAQQGAHVDAVDTKSIPSNCVGNPNIHWVQSYIHEFALPKNTYNLVIMRNVLHFLKREYVTKIFSQQVVQSLKSGGCLFLATFEQRDIVFEKNLSGYYSAEELLVLFKPLEFLAPVREVIQDDHPPYGKHQHFVVKYVGQKPQ